jgi:CBS domain-containing protein
MGEHDVRESASSSEVRRFTRAILSDLRALETMLERGMIEDGVRRAGAEQEMFLVDAECRPMSIADELLTNIGDAAFTSELGQFNLEANLQPRKLHGSFLRDLEVDLEDVVSTVNRAAAAFGARVLLTGILPTLRHEDLALDNLTPQPRFRRLIDALARLRSGSFPIHVDGIDVLDAEFDSVMLESANTSLQLHLQVGQHEFARTYNLAQLITGPLLAAATNSPLLLGRRLWHETRVAVFERAVDVRSSAQLARGHLSRVSFGDAWLYGSILDIFRENLERFQVLVTREIDVDPMAMVRQGTAPALSALMLHNGTVYRWNRPCYGVADGIAHVRIENRVLPAGPTVIDEVANAALFYGLMLGLDDAYGDVSTRLSFEHAKANFVAAAEHGIKAEFNWVDTRKVSARELLERELIPAAREGLQQAQVPSADIDRYLGIVEERVASGQNGSSWLLDSFDATHARGTHEARCSSVTRAMLERQSSGEPVHRWAKAQSNVQSEQQNRGRTVRDIMSTDLFTVLPEDVLDLAASIMQWRHIRHVPVENAEGRLVGLLSHRALLQLHSRPLSERGDQPISVAQVMDPNPITISPDAELENAAEKLLSAESGCLLVVDRDRLLGIATERDFLRAAYPR